MNYADTLDKALSYLRELELDKATSLLFKLLVEHPKDIELINRIYALEVKRPHSKNFQKICQHIFDINSNKLAFRQLIINTYIEFTKHHQLDKNLKKETLFNLFCHFQALQVQENRLNVFMID